MVGHVLAEPGDGGVELLVLPVEGGDRHVLDFDVRRDALVLDQPVSVQVEIRVLGRAGIAVVDQTIPVRQPDAGTCRTLTKQRRDMQGFDALGESLAVRIGHLIGQDDQTALEGLLHVHRRRIAVAAPEHPRATHELRQDPAVNIAARIATDVHDQAVLVDIGIELAGEGFHVVPDHGLQMQIADASVAGAIDDIRTADFPVARTQVTLLHIRNRGYDDLVLLSCARERQENLLSGLIGKERTQIGLSGRGLSVDGNNKVSVTGIHARSRQRGLLVREIAVALIDMVDAEAIVFMRQMRAKTCDEAGRGLIDGRGRVELRVHGADFRHHLSEQIVEIRAVPEAVHEGREMGAHGFPVHAVQIAVIVMIAVQTPGIHEFVRPLLSGIDPQAQMVEFDLLAGQFLGLLFTRRCQEQVGGVLALTADGQQGLAVGRDVEIRNLGGVGFDLVFVIVDMDRLQIARTIA